MRACVIKMLKHAIIIQNKLIDNKARGERFALNNNIMMINY